MKYTEIYDFWNANPCNGGDKDFPFEMCKGKRILEIGCGAGIDALRFVKAGAIYTGIDLTDEAVRITKQKIGNKGTVLKMNAEFLDFPDNHFDLVYSFGVIHHTINPDNVIKEIKRVLIPKGLICIMLYNKPSWRWFEIMYLRKILWFLHYYKFNNIRKLIPHPTKEQWISINTDGIGCPLSRIYTKDQAVNLIKTFRDIRTFTTEYGWFRILTGRK